MSRFLLVQLLIFCGCVAVDQDADDFVSPKADGLGPTGSIPVLPTTWGGGDPGRWRPEAILANAVSEAMNRAWGLPGARDVVVAVPVHMLSSEFFEFGDGQANAAVS